MTNIRRYFGREDICFLTHVTYNRLLLLIDNFDLWHAAVERTLAKCPFGMIAWVALPNHCHLMIDPQGQDVSTLMRRLKLSFSTSLRKRAGERSGRVWQYRFWDHIIRDDSDLRHHVDYIHYNPVKHRLVRSAKDWAYSSFSEWMRAGYYAPDWGANESQFENREYGE
jgi:putative transposase